VSDDINEEYVSELSRKFNLDLPPHAKGIIEVFGQELSKAWRERASDASVGLTTVEILEGRLALANEKVKELTEKLGGPLWHSSSSKPPEIGDRTVVDATYLWQLRNEFVENGQKLKDLILDHTELTRENEALERANGGLKAERDELRVSLMADDSALDADVALLRESLSSKKQWASLWKKGATEMYRRATTEYAEHSVAPIDLQRTQEEAEAWRKKTDEERSARGRLANLAKETAAKLAETKKLLEYEQKIYRDTVKRLTMHMTRVRAAALATVGEVDDENGEHSRFRAVADHEWFQQQVAKDFKERDDHGR
jgi:hypothetical protein